MLKITKTENKKTIFNFNLLIKVTVVLMVVALIASVYVGFTSSDYRVQTMMTLGTCVLTYTTLTLAFGGW